MNYLEVLFKVNKEEQNKPLLNIYREKDILLQNNFEKRPKLNNCLDSKTLDLMLDLCDDNGHTANTLISILEKAIFSVRTEIKDIKKHITFTELQEDAAFDAANKDTKMSKTEYEKLKKFYISNKTFNDIQELEDLKMIEEFGNLELKRINRIKCEFEEFNMNVKKKYQLMV